MTAKRKAELTALLFAQVATNAMLAQPTLTLIAYNLKMVALLDIEAGYL